MALIIALILISHEACASHIGDAASAPHLKLLAIFRACKTGVLRVRAEDVNEGWLRHCQLLPTRESVDRVGRLLLEDSASTARSSFDKKADSGLQNVLAAALDRFFYCCTGGEPARCPRNVLVTLLRNRASVNWRDAWTFLIKYMVFKAVLYGGIGKDEAKTLNLVCSEMPMKKARLVMLRKLISNLTDTGFSSDLFIALATCSQLEDICEVLSGLAAQCPEIVAKLVRMYAVTAKECIVFVELDLFVHLNDEGRYDILAKHSMCVGCIYDTGECDLSYKHSNYKKGSLFKGMSWRNIYILSKFSWRPSKSIKEACLKTRPKYLTYEETTVQVKGALLIKLECFDSKKLPKEIWIKILLYCESFLFQVYTVPMVCRFWRRLHHTLLVCSPAIQRAFVRDFGSASKMHRILNYRRCPWNYFLRTPMSLLRYFLLCRESGQLEAGEGAKKYVEAVWKQLVQEISKGKLPISSASYVDIYVHCCKTIKGSLELCQLPNMADDDYVALIRKLVEQHEIIPVITTRLLEGDCGRLVQMLERDSDLAVLLLRHDQRCCDKLAINLFLARARVPPAVEHALYKTSPLYRLLTDEGDSAGACLGAILQSPAEDHGASRAARYVVDVCLARGRQSQSETPAISRKETWPKGAAWKSYLDRACGDDWPSVDPDCSVEVRLTLVVMIFLCRHCQDYSEEEFSIVERVLEQFRLLDAGIARYTSKICAPMLLNDPKIAVVLV